jgi:hypothetical protein
MTASPFDAETHYAIVDSESPITVDGYNKGEPKWLQCEECDARVQLTEDPSAGVDDLPHGPDCSQRFARSRYWRRRFAMDG